MSNMALNWGIAGAGRISYDFVAAVHLLPSTDHKVVAVAGRNKENTEKFAKTHKIPKVYNDYEKLAADPEIDIVYIGNLNTQHFDTAKLMLENNKHVLCEKPLTMNEKQTARLVQIAKNRKKFLMEAVWSRCFPAYIKARELIESGTIGDVLFAEVSFGHPLQHVERLTSSELGGGAILDLGIYILQFQQFVFRGYKPVKVVANGLKNKYGTDEFCSAIITYPEGRAAVVTTSARISLPNEGIIVGTKGRLILPTFWCPTQLIVEETNIDPKSPTKHHIQKKVLEFELPKGKLEFNHQNSAGLSYEAEEARQCIKAGKIESPQVPHAESIELARLEDLLRKEVGVVFPEDSKEY